MPDRITKARTILQMCQARKVSIGNQVASVTTDSKMTSALA